MTVQTFHAVVSGSAGVSGAATVAFWAASCQAGMEAFVFKKFMAASSDFGVETLGDEGAAATGEVEEAAEEAAPAYDPEFQGRGEEAGDTAAGPAPGARRFNSKLFKDLISV